MVTNIKIVIPKIKYLNGDTELLRRTKLIFFDFLRTANAQKKTFFSFKLQKRQFFIW